MIVRTRDGGRERRSIGTSGGFGNWDSLSMTGVVPPHGWDTTVPSGVPITERSVTKASPVNRCLSILANEILIMGNPLPYTVVYDPTTNLPSNKYVAPAPPILSNTFGTLPDGRPKSQSEGLSGSVYSMALFGEALWITLTRNSQGLPSAVQLLHPAFVNVGSDTNGNPTYSYALPGKDPLPMDLENVTHIKRQGRPGHIRGQSSLLGEALGYGLFLAASQFGQLYFGQGLNASYVLSSDQSIAQETVERIQAKLLVEHSGLSNAHLPLILSNGLKPSSIGVTPDQSQYLSTLAVGAMSIADYFGIPGAWLNMTDSKVVVGKTLEESAMLHYRTTLSGYLVPLNEAFTSLLVPGQFAMIDPRSLMRGNSADIAKEIVSLRTGTVMTINELRRIYYDLPPVAGGDNLDAPLASNIAPPAPDSEPDSPDGE